MTEIQLPDQAADTPRPIDLSRPVVLHTLTFLEEGEDVTVGRQDINSFCVLPADGAALLKELGAGRTPEEVASWYAQTYDQEVNMQDFLEAMEELGFLAADAAEVRQVAPVRWQRLGRAVFSPPAMAGYCALIAAAAFEMARDHRLLPQYHNLFFSPYVMVISLTIYLLQVPLVALHEGFHALAGRRLGLNTSFGFGRRLWFIVVETSMDGLVTVPRRKRYWPILCGMFADLLSIAVLTLIGAAARRPDGSEPLAAAICLTLAFATLIRFLWQFYFYLRTDMYFVAVTVLGCVDLHEAARRINSNRMWRLLRRTDKLTDEEELHPTDRRVGRWYSWLLILGYGFSLGTALAFGLPAALKVVQLMWDHVAHSTGAGGVLDTVVFVLVNLAQGAFLGFLFLRERRRRRTAVKLQHVIA